MSFEASRAARWRGNDDADAGWLSDIWSRRCSVFIQGRSSSRGLGVDRCGGFFPLSSFCSTWDAEAVGLRATQWNILDQSYEIIATVQANKSEEGLDPHDVSPTWKRWSLGTTEEAERHGSQLSIRGEVATVEFWKPTRTNLTSVGGSVDGWVYDCRVQSINITSGALLFDWSALAHVPVNETYYDLKHPQGTRETREFFIFWGRGFLEEH